MLSAFFPKSVSEIFMFDMHSSIYLIIHLLIKIFALNLYLQCGTMPSQKGSLVLWELASPEPTWHGCSYDRKSPGC